MTQLAWTSGIVAADAATTPAPPTGLFLLATVGRAVDRWTPFGPVFPVDNPAALGSYYLAMLTFIPALGALLGGEAIWLGVRGLADARRLPGYRGGAHAVVGILLGAASILLHAVWFWAAFSGRLA